MSTARLTGPNEKFFLDFKTLMVNHCTCGKSLSSVEDNKDKFAYLRNKFGRSSNQLGKCLMSIPMSFCTLVRSPNSVRFSLSILKITSLMLDAHLKASIPRLMQSMSVLPLRDLAQFKVDVAFEVIQAVEGDASHVALHSGEQKKI